MNYDNMNNPLLDALMQTAVYSAPIAFKHTTSIDTGIGEAEGYQELISVLLTAGENDTVHILINTPGGSLDTANAIIAAMRQCRAHIITEITGQCCSAGTLIFLEGHEYRVNEGAVFMMHHASYGAWNKANNVAELVTFFDRIIKKQLRQAYEFLLTPSEIEQLVTGKDFWMDAEELSVRLECRQESLAALEEEGAAAVTEETIAAFEEIIAELKEGKE